MLLYVLLFLFGCFVGFAGLLAVFFLLFSVINDEGPREKSQPRARLQSQNREKI
jgi:hypothetical protein